MLAHEQLHFDIIELTGRRIQQVLARCAAQQLDSHTPVITQEITRIYNEEVLLDNRYDEEAGYVDDPQAQARWQALIDQKLAALKAYKSTPADCELPQ